MSEALFLELIQQTLLIVIELSMPVLFVSLVVGLIISLFQAVTQIQEATLTFVPKIIACLLAISILGPWMLNVFVNFTVKLLENLNSYI
jgi:flagellar biosynthesis protein FliQ